MKKLIVAAMLAASMTLAPSVRADDAVAETQYPVYDDGGTGWATAAWQDGLEACWFATVYMFRKYVAGDSLP